MEDIEEGKEGSWIEGRKGGSWEGRVWTSRTVEEEGFESSMVSFGCC